MTCPDCGKKLPENAVKCNKCGKQFKQQTKKTETDDFLKKEKEKADIRAEKLQKKNEKLSSRKPVNKKAVIIACSCVALAAVITVIVLFATGVFKKKPAAASNTPGSINNDPVLGMQYTTEEVSAQDALFKSESISISEAEYEFFFRQSYSNIQNAGRLSFQDFAREKVGEDFDETKLDEYYQKYSEDFFKENDHTFDYKKPVNNQRSTALDENKKEITWQEYIRNDAISTMEKYRVKFALAQQSGMEITDDIKLQVYNHIEGLRSAVTQGGGGTLEDYLKTLFGESCDEEYFKNELIREYMASKYDTVNTLSLIDSYSENDIKAIYDKDNAKYDYADIFVFEVTDDVAKKAGKEIKDVADSIYRNTKNLDGFTAAIQDELGITSDKTSLPAVPGNYLSQTYAPEMTEWVFSRERKADDVNLFKTEKGYVVTVIQAPAYSKKDCSSYREIVLKKTDDEGKALSEDKLREIQETANEILKKCTEEGANADTFAYYAIKNSQSSSASAGGLVSCVPADEITDEKIKSWAAENNTPGKTDMIETEDSYIILRYEKHYDNYWDFAIRSEKAAEDNEKLFKDAQNGLIKFNYETKDVKALEDEIIVSLNMIYLGIGVPQQQKQQ